MKQFRLLLASAALAALTVAANAQAVTGRSFSYSSSDLVDADFSGAGDVDLKARTTVTVNPYLYINGNLGAEWTVDGWGSGVDARTESIKFYHNETLTLDFDGFDAPAKTSGTTTGAQAIDLRGQLTFFADQTNAELYDSGLVDIADLNGMFEPSGPSFEVDATAGLMRLDFTRRISIVPNVGPGVYENVGLIRVIRN